MYLGWLRFLKKQEVDFDLPAYQAHRGYWVQGDQENTMSALVKARQLGFLMAELDVQLSKDLVPVVFHDSTTKRFSDKDLMVADMTAKQLSELVHAPTLEEVLLSSETPEFINIEIKSPFPGNGRLEKSISKLIRGLQEQGLLKKKVMFSSFNPISLYRMQNELPQIPRALLAAPDEEHLWLCFLLKVHGVNLSFKQADQSVIVPLKEKGIALSVWTLNEAEIAQKLLSLGVHSIITDKIIPN